MGIGKPPAGRSYADRSGHWPVFAAERFNHQRRLPNGRSHGHLCHQLQHERGHQPADVQDRSQSRTAVMAIEADAGAGLETLSSRRLDAPTNPDTATLLDDVVPLRSARTDGAMKNRA